MRPQNSLTASLIGTIIIALCCFTPLLVVILGAIGLGAWIGYLDLILLPAFGAMVGLTVLSYWRYRRHCQN